MMYQSPVSRLRRLPCQSTFSVKFSNAALRNQRKSFQNEDQSRYPPANFILPYSPIQSQGWPMALKVSQLLTLGSRKVSQYAIRYEADMLFSWWVFVWSFKGRNTVGISATGSGKTLAFLLPAMIHINAQVSSLTGLQISTRTRNCQLATNNGGITIRE